MIVRIFRWSARAALIIGLFVVLAALGFRGAAAIREQGIRADLAPAAGQLVPTKSGGVFIQQTGPLDGIPVVLFHGTGAWSELWRGTAGPLAAAGFRVIALDLPPFGFSDRPGDYTRRAQAARINDVLGHLNAPPAIIVGHSFGAGAAMELVMRHPARARGLVLVDAALGLTGAVSDPPFLLESKWLREILVSLTVTNPLATKPLLRTMIEKKDRALPEYVEILQRPIRLQNTTRDVADWLHYFAGADRDAMSADRKAYPKVNVPSVILWGDKDSVTPPDQARDIKTLLPHALLTWLPGLGHIPQVEDPAMFNDMLLKTLRTL